MNSQINKLIILSIIFLFILYLNGCSENENSLIWVKQQLILKVDNNILNWKQENNGASYNIWVRVESDRFDVPQGFEYVGTVRKKKWDGCYSLDDVVRLENLQQKNITDFCAKFNIKSKEKIYLINIPYCPKWWNLNKGYKYYFLQKGSSKNLPEIKLMLFVSPDKKEVLIYQFKDTRSN